MHAKTRPYQKLGQIIEAWRQKRFRSASEMFRELKLSFVYRTYIDIEGGSSLPSLPQLFEIAKLLEQDPALAVLAWAEAQMPSDELKALFSSRAGAPTHKPSQAEEPDLSKTWVFGKAEFEYLQKEPWFFEFCLKLILAFPNSVGFGELGFENRDQFGVFVDRYLRPWISLGRIAESETGVRAVEPFVFLPQSSDWNEIRGRNFRSAYEKLNHKITPENVKNHLAVREIVTRCLTRDQIANWIDELHRIEAQFRNQPGVEKPPSAENEVYSFLFAFAPRELAIPREVLERCKKP